jgi:glutamine cyclotransferase
MHLRKQTTGKDGFRPLLYIFILLLLALGCKSKKEEKPLEDTQYLSYTVQRSLPHDIKAFTQGFTIHKGLLYESTGQNNSWIGVVDIKTGVAEKKVELPAQFFGEGITILNNKIYQLTWQNKIGFVYDLTTFKKVKEFNYSQEGWGLTHDKQQLIMSDGTDKLYFLDTLTMNIVKSLTVTYQGKPVSALNELEYVEGFIYANVWQTALIAKIDATTGKVEGFLDLTPLTKQAGMINPNQDVLNGIAWHEGTQSLLVTGKYWPLIYVLKLAK